MPLIPIEEPSTDLLLQCPNLNAERRLGNMLALGSAREAQFFCDRDEIAKSANFHDIYIVSKVIAILYWRI